MKTKHPAQRGVLRIFAHDPGSRNYGYAIVEGKKNGNKIGVRILENGLCPCPMNNLKDHKIRQKQRDLYLDWVYSTVKKWEISGLFAERYMTRGIKGPTIESVNMMLGLLQSLCMPDRYIPAAVWKNAVRRQGWELDKEYKICKTAPHQLDASLIGVWAIHQAFAEKDFGTMRKRDLIRIVDQIEKTSKTKLVNRKTKR
jgi:hypothetical protein